MRNVSVKLYIKFRPMVKEEMTFKDISILAQVAILFSGAERFVQFWSWILTI